jgi:hypothetical protein
MSPMLTNSHNKTVYDLAQYNNKKTMGRMITRLYTIANILQKPRIIYTIDAYSNQTKELELSGLPHEIAEQIAQHTMASSYIYS